MRVLVTGGCGYIGTKVVLKLIERGHRVRIMDIDDSNGEIVPHDFLLGDIRDTALLAQALEGVDTVIHLAAVVPYLGGGPPHPLESQMDEINHLGACTVARLSKEKGVKHFVFTSTCSTYGLGEGLDENAPQKATIPYATSKIKAEQCILRENPHATILRLATVFGPSSRIGWHPVFNAFVRDSVVNGKLDIFNPDAYRSYIYINDVVRAIVIIAEAPAEVVSGEIYNVGGVNCTKRELALLIKEFFPDTIIEMDNGTQKGYSVSFEKIAKLGFKVETDPREGVAQFAKILSPR